MVKSAIECLSIYDHDYDVWKKQKRKQNSQNRNNVYLSIKINYILSTYTTNPQTQIMFIN